MKEENKERNKGLAALTGSTIYGVKKTKDLKKSDKVLEKLDENKKGITKKLEEEAKRMGINVKTSSAKKNLSSGYFPGLKLIITGQKNDPTSLSHELGHAHYNTSGWKGNVVGKAAHKGYIGGGFNFEAIQPLAAVKVGRVTGKKKARLEKEGKKESTLSKNAAWITPAAIAIPGLISEGMASKHGLKLLKKSGASEKLLKESKKNLKDAWGTYAAKTALNSSIGQLSRGKAYKKEKKKLDSED